MLPKTALRALFISLVIAAGPSYSATSSYIFEELKGPLGGWEATGINASGQITGTVSDPTGASRAAVWTNGSPVMLQRSATSSRAWSINNQGQVAGEIWTTATGRTAAVWSNGTETVLARTRDTTSQYATGINDAALVVGNRSQDYERTSQAVVWQNYNVTPLDMLGATSSYATGINNSGQISGYLSYVDGDSTRTQAVVWSSDQATLLQGTAGRALAISDAGVAVGDMFDNGTSMPVYWQGTGVANELSAPSTGGRALGVNSVGQAVGTGFVGPWGTALLWDLQTRQFTDLNSYLTPEQVAAGWILNRAIAIDDLGDIAGIAYNTKQASFRPFALIAVPESSTLAYMSLGLVANTNEMNRAHSNDGHFGPTA